MPSDKKAETGARLPEAKQRLGLSEIGESKRDPPREASDSPALPKP